MRRRCNPLRWRRGWCTLRRRRRGRCTLRRRRRGRFNRRYPPHNHRRSTTNNRLQRCGQRFCKIDSILNFRRAGSATCVHGDCYFPLILECKPSRPYDLCKPCAENNNNCIRNLSSATTEHDRSIINEEKDERQPAVGSTDQNKIASLQVTTISNKIF